ncbi:hypothetical protein [Candidatus Oleimmundimicrobium sp.]|uniref:hypothetical protein n=1 Tax=Candidatus Oleimmundimicrobium sp. TaxID=3060597 RepID=UPI00272511B7|nr:hypothetical protein [Candidatus Oleimmundimicrobium sp.]MDO8886342.1 hypothetical protein [Candidatus Oleimmundimicrobium sp.]
MIMNQNSKEIFEDCRETIVMYYTYLHLGYFYSQLSKHEDLSCKSRNIWIDFGTNKYLLRENIIKRSLADMYKKSQSPDFFSHLILNNSIRGITMALFEALKDAEIKNLFLEHIFRNDEEAYNNFEGVVRFIRNTFSHNIRDRIELRKKDYEKQRDYLRKKGKYTLNFFFDYAKSSIPISRENYTVEIDIDFNQIEDRVVYADIILEYQTLLFIELCYKCMEYLKDKLG